MTEPILTRSDTAKIATLTLNNPAKLNALSTAMLAALQAELDRLATDETIRVVILRAAGRAFCAGHDLGEMAAARQGPDRGAAALADLFERCARVMISLTRLPQPVIAEVQGLATAAGCQLVASCDMAIAAEEARFGVNGINIGLFCATPMVALTRAVPRKAAFEMLSTGGFVAAPRAAEIGLINRAVPADRLAAETRTLAETLAGKLGPVLTIGKRAFYDQAELGLEDAYALTGRVMVANMAREDTAEGIRAFLEKRPPAWTG